MRTKNGNWQVLNSSTVPKQAVLCNNELDGRLVGDLVGESCRFGAGDEKGAMLKLWMIRNSKY